MIHILLINFHAVTDPAGYRAVDCFHVLWLMIISLYEKLQEAYNRNSRPV